MSIITLSQEQGNKNSEIARLALTTVLRRKGLVLDAVADGIQTLRSEFASQPETQKLFDHWLNVQQQLSTLVYKEQGKQSATDYQTQYQHLVVEKERLEEAISVKSAEFRNQTQPVELQAIQSHIPQDAAIVEIVQYQLFNPKAKENQRWGESHYAAAVLRSSGEPKWVDLGYATTINKAIAELRTALALAGSRSSIEVQPINGTHKNSLPQVQQLARKVDILVMAPIRPLLGNARHLLLSPDGQLTLIPFEALVDEKGKYLIQSYAFSYLTSGRDLLRLQSVASSQTAPVIFADVDYNQQTTVSTYAKIFM